MPPTLQRLGADILSTGERFALAKALRESVGELLAPDPFSPEVRVGFEHRVALTDAHPTRGETWEEVRAAARARWSR